MVKNLPANAGDTGSVLRLGRSPGVGNSNSFQYSCLENSMDRGDWQDTVHGVTKSWARLSNSAHTHIIGLHSATEDITENYTMPFFLSS